MILGLRKFFCFGLSRRFYLLLLFFLVFTLSDAGIWVLVQVVQSLVELLDNRHFLVVKQDLVVVNDLQHRLCNQQAQRAVSAPVVQDLEHPEDCCCVDHLVLVLGSVLYVKVYYVQQQVQNAVVL